MGYGAARAEPCRSTLSRMADMRCTSFLPPGHFGLHRGSRATSRQVPKRTRKEKCCRLRPPCRHAELVHHRNTLVLLDQLVIGFHARRFHLLPALRDCRGFKAAVKRPDRDFPPPFSFGSADSPCPSAWALTHPGRRTMLRGDVSAGDSAVPPPRWEAWPGCAEPSRSAVGWTGRTPC